MLTIFIIEDDHNFLVNTINGINMSKDFKIVGTLQKGSDIKQHIEDVIKADIILVDESIPEISSVEMLFECFLPLFDSSLLIHKTHKKQAKKYD